ncbi:helix-turn-helix domain-containing protein [Agrobacterium sp. CMT1]|uniref:MarR family transcriptional regulator n=1 Tax=Agrobacterium sp. CMT1 TaxID=3128901 RepID=UPI0030779512
MVKSVSGISPFLTKWGVRVGRSTYSMLPNNLIWINDYIDEEFKLNPSEMVVLINIISNWWKEDQIPAVSKSLISKRTRLSQRQVQRTISSLEEKGYIKRVYVGQKAGGANGFLISGTIQHVETVISRRLQVIDQQREMEGKPSRFDEFWSRENSVEFPEDPPF